MEEQRTLDTLDLGSDNPNVMSVEGIVTKPEKEPLVVLLRGRTRVALLSMAQARNLAFDMWRMASRTEADAMILKFFDTMEYPEGAAVAVMGAFAKFRHELDQENPRETV